MAAHLGDFPKDDALASAVAGAVAKMGTDDFRTLTDGGALGPVYVSSSALPFEQWRLLTAIPRSAFAAEIDRNTRRVLFVVGALALLAAATAVLFANLLFARPIRRLAGAAAADRALLAGRCQARADLSRRAQRFLARR